MANTKEFFLSVTRRIFSNWTALKMAVEHGMGTKERAMDLSPYITEIMFTNEGLISSEIADELENYMDEYFNTELQDHSAIQVAEELLRFYSYCIQGNEAVAVAEFEKLPAFQSWFDPRKPLQKIPELSIITNDDSSSENDEISENIPAMEDEWMEVKSRRKR